MKKDKNPNIKEKAKFWIKNPYNLAISLVFLFMLVTHIYWFFQTYNQPLWWDEADYMNMARTWIGKVEWQASAVRGVLLPAIASLLMILGLGEISVRFFILLSSLSAIIFMYALGNLFFNKRIAFFSSFILAVFWSFSFFSHRILTDVPVAMLWLAAIYFFFNAYFKEKSWKHFALAGVFLGLAFLMKSVSAVLVIFLAFYILTAEKLSVFRNKKIYVFFLASLLVITPFLIYYFTGLKQGEMKPGNPSFNDISDNIKSLIRQLPFIFSNIKTTLTILFFIGLLLILFKIHISYKQIFSKNTDANKSYIFLLWLVSSLIFFSKLLSYDTAYLDDRYYFVFYPAVFFICASGIDFLYNCIKQYHKQLALIALIFLLLFIAYQNISYANHAISTKKNSIIDSFIQLKLAGEYVKANSNPGDIILILEEQAEVSYYAERSFIQIGTDNATSITEKISKYKPKYAVMSFYYSLGNDFSYSIIDYVFAHPEIFKPVQAYKPYVDKDEILPWAIVFEISPYNKTSQAQLFSANPYVIESSKLNEISKFWTSIKLSS